jgi:hypothetical protein
MQCRLTDLSLEGCRLRTVQRFNAEMGLRVEVAFRVNGLSFKFAGITEWTNRWNLVGIKFVDVPRRCRADLAELIGELKEDGAAVDALALADGWEADQEAESAGGGELATPEDEANDRIHAVPYQVRRARKPRAAQGDGQAGAEAQSLERRTEPRHALDAAAVIQLVNNEKGIDTSSGRGASAGIEAGARLRGRIVDLSATGCRIRTDEEFPAGIYARVETEFRAEGTPFRLAGVIQAIHERCVVGIRFLEVSARKRAQLAQLMREIDGHRAG